MEPDLRFAAKAFLQLIEICLFGRRPLGPLVEVCELRLRLFRIKRRHIVGNKSASGDNQAIVVHDFDHYFATGPLFANADLPIRRYG